MSKSEESDLLVDIAGVVLCSCVATLTSKVVSY